MRLHASKGFPVFRVEVLKFRPTVASRTASFRAVPKCFRLADSSPAQVEQQMKPKGSNFGYSRVQLESSQLQDFTLGLLHHPNPKAACRQVKEAREAEDNDFRELRVRSEVLLVSSQQPSPGTCSPVRRATKASWLPGINMLSGRQYVGQQFRFRQVLLSKRKKTHAWTYLQLTSDRKASCE